MKIEHGAVVTQRLVKLLFAGDLFGDIKLAADLRERIEQRDMMTAGGGVNGEGQTGRPGADDRQPFRRVGRQDRHQGFMTGARVDQTRGDFAGEDPIETRLVATDAGIDLPGAIALRFRHKFGVGEERAGHRYHIGIAAGENILRDLRIVDAVGGDQRDRHRAFQLAGDPAESSARYRRGDGRNARFVPANPGVDNCRPRRFNRFGQFGDFRQRAAVVDQIEHRQAVDDNEIVAGALAYRLNHLYGETHAPGIIAAPLVVALVGARGEKFVNQIALRAHHFDAVISRFTRQLGAVGKIIDQRQDLIVAQFMGCKTVNRRL